MPIPALALIGIGAGLGATQGVFSSLSTAKTNKRYAKALRRSYNATQAQLARASTFSSRQTGAAERAQAGSYMATGRENLSDVLTASFVKAFFEDLANRETNKYQQQSTFLETKSRIASMRNPNPFLAGLTGAASGAALGAGFVGVV